LTHVAEQKIDRRRRVLAPYKDRRLIWMIPKFRQGQFNERQSSLNFYIVSINTQKN